MERNNDGKKTHSSPTPGIVTDTRVPWHRLSLAACYRGIRPQSDSWLADTDHPSYTYIYISIYIYLPVEMPRDRAHWRQSLLAFPGREAAPERAHGSSSTRALGDGATTIVLCQWPGMVLLGVSHLRAMNPPVQVGHREKPTPEVTCAAHSSGGDPPRREVAALPVAHTIHGGRGLHQLGLAQGARGHVSPCASPSPPDLQHRPPRTKTGTPNRRDEADLGLAPVLLPSAGARGSLPFGDILGGSWSHLLACSLYKYLLRGKDIKSTVQ